MQQVFDILQQDQQKQPVTTPAIVAIEPPARAVRETDALTSLGRGRMWVEKIR
jgi:hypothetical protein